MDLPAAAGGELDDEVLDAQQDLVVGTQVGGSAAGHQDAPVSSVRPASSAWGSTDAVLAPEGADCIMSRAWICTLISSVSGEPTG